MEEKNVTFTAVYGLRPFNPTNPEDPNVSYKYPLNFISYPEEAGSFNYGNETRFAPGEWVYVTAYTSQGFEFIGWYDQDPLISISTSFNYEMPNAMATLKACFISPSDPSSSEGQQNVSNTSRADVNGDNIIDVSDATAVINWFLNQDGYDLKYDMNVDTTIDVSDATYIINNYLNE